MHTLKIALTLVVALVLQLLLPKHLAFFRYIDLTLLVTVYFGLQRAPLTGMLTGMFAGLGADIVGGGILGVNGFTKTLIGYLVSIASIKLALENPLARLAVVAVASAANTVLIVGLNQLLEQSLPYAATWSDFGGSLGWSVSANLIAAVAVLIILDRIFSEQVEARRMAIKRRFYD